MASGVRRAACEHRPQNACEEDASPEQHCAVHDHANTIRHPKARHDLVRELDRPEVDVVHAKPLGREREEKRDRGEDEGEASEDAFRPREPAAETRDNERHREGRACGQHGPANAVRALVAIVRDLRLDRARDVRAERDHITVPELHVTREIVGRMRASDLQHEVGLRPRRRDGCQRPRPIGRHRHQDVPREEQDRWDNREGQPSQSPGTRRAAREQQEVVAREHRREEGGRDDVVVRGAHCRQEHHSRIHASATLRPALRRTRQQGQREKDERRPVGPDQPDVHTARARMNGQNAHASASVTLTTRGQPSTRPNA